MNFFILSAQTEEKRIRFGKQNKHRIYNFDNSLISIFIHYTDSKLLEDFVTQLINAIIQETSTNKSLLSDLVMIKLEMDYY